MKTIIEKSSNIIRQSNFCLGDKIWIIIERKRYNSSSYNVIVEGPMKIYAKKHK